MKKSKYTTAARKAMDYDYLDKLTLTEKEFLEAFNNANYAGNIKDLKKVSPKLKKEFEAANNSRNRDILNKLAPGGDVSEFTDQESPADSFGSMAEVAAKNRGKARNAYRLKK
jgi:phage tail tape-measure protein